MSVTSITTRIYLSLFINLYNIFELLFVEVFNTVYIILVLNGLVKACVFSADYLKQVQYDKYLMLLTCCFNQKQKLN